MNNKKNIILSGVIALFAIALFLLPHFLPPTPLPMDTSTVSKDTVEDFEIYSSINYEPVFFDGTTEGSLLIVNGELNKYPQVVEIYRDDTSELIYRSGSIPVGNRVVSGKLLIDLDAGEYACTAYFHSVHPETNERLGHAAVQIEVVVEN